MDFKKISDMSALVVPVLIVCSCIRLLTYYSHWNIPIFDYVSASEILLLFIQPILVIAALAAIYPALTLALAMALLLVLSLFSGKDKTKSEKKHPVYSWIFAIASVGVVAGTLFMGMWSDGAVVPTVLFHLFLFIGVFDVVRRFPPTPEQEKRVTPLVAAVLVVLVSGSFFYGRYQARPTEMNPTRLELVLRDDTLLKVDPDRIYVGKTSSYYFFHSKNENSIIPVGEVKATYIK